MNSPLPLVFAKVTFLVGLAGLLTLPLPAQNVTTVPEGYISYTINGSPTGTSHKITYVSAPLISLPTTTGARTGRITSITSNTVTSAGASWTTSELVNSGPVYIHIKSGNQVGLMLLITANTSDTLTLDTENQNLITLGILTGSNGDTFELIQGETVLSMFGTPADGIIGGNATQFSSGQTDRLVLRDNTGVTRTLYYNTDFNQWRRGGSGANQGTIRISPHSGAIYYRISTTPLTITSTGTVPSVSSRQLVPQSGAVFLSRFFPTDITLGALGIENMPNWRSTNDFGITAQTADKVIVTDNAGIVRQFFHDGISWKRGGSGSSQNSVVIPAGASVLISRFGSTTNTESFTLNLPYQLNN